MQNQTFSLTRLGLTTLVFIAPWLTLVPSALADKVAASAAFIVDGNGNATAVSVSVAVGANDAYSRSFYDPGTGNLSSVAIGSQGNINVTGETTVGIGEIQDSTTFTPPGQPDDGNAPPLKLPNTPSTSGTASFLKNYP